MRNGTFYLNNSGSRWVNLTNGKKDVINVLTPDNNIIQRTAMYYESFGNFASVTFSWKGRKLSRLFDEIEHPDKPGEFIAVVRIDLPKIRL